MVKVTPKWLKKLKFRGKPLIRTSKIPNFILQTELFTTLSGRSIRYIIFQKEELGQLRASLPIKELAALLPNPKSTAGSKPWFDNEGKIALQFLKIYEDCSDDKLLAHLNRDWGLWYSVESRSKDKRPQFNLADSKICSRTFRYSKISERYDCSLEAGHEKYPCRNE